MSEAIATSGASPVATSAGGRTDIHAGWKIMSTYGDVEAELTAARERVALSDGSAVGKLVMQGEDIEEVLADTFGVCPGAPTELATFDAGWLTKMNRYEYYAALPLEQLDETVATLQTAFEGVHAHVTSLTHGRDALALVGPHAAGTLSKLCALDLHPSAFPDRHAQIGRVAGVTTLIARLDRGNVRRYELHLDRSYGGYVWEVILDAADEFGGECIGREALGQLS